MVKTVMAVDDDPDIVVSVKAVLEAARYKVICADSGERCLELLENNQVPDLVLLDVVMPGMSGWQTFKQMQKKPFLKDVPVVFVTVRDDNIARFIGGYLGDGISRSLLT